MLNGSAAQPALQQAASDTCGCAAAQPQVQVSISHRRSETFADGLERRISAQQPAALEIDV